MRTFFSAQQLRHSPEHEFNRGTYGPTFEHAGRIENILAALKRAGHAPTQEPEQFPLEAVTRVHDPAFVAFLQNAFSAWRALGRSGDALPISWPYRGSNTVPPTSLDGCLGYYSFDIMTPITETTWDAAKASVDTALSAAALISGGGVRAAFSLCRPPGHHAGTNTYGGYCFLNSAAVAAQYLRDHGATKIAVLDVDYHHGNGTQEIFYDRADVLYVSLHGDPKTDFPYFSGHADETGRGAGTGFNLNLPLPRGTQWSAWSMAFDTAESAIKAFKPDALVVSLGIDNLEGDPLSHFAFQVDDYARVGERVARLRLPTAIIFEGGYLIEKLGAGVVRTLQGFEGV